MLVHIFSCRQQHELNEKEKSTIVNEVKQMLNTYYADVKKSGLTAEFKYLDNSPDFFWTPPGFTGAITYDSVVAILRERAPTYRLIDNSFSKLQVVPLSETHAVYYGKLRSAITDTTGKTMSFSMVETGIAVKRKEGWKLLSGQTAIVDK